MSSRIFACVSTWQNKFCKKEKVNKMHALNLLIFFLFYARSRSFYKTVMKHETFKNLNEWKHERMQKDLLKKLSWLVDTGLWLSCIEYNDVPDLKLWPGHGHVDPVCVGPPAQVLFMVSVVYRVVKFIIDLRQPGAVIR